jgi:uncharacterized protein involved in exopolysaccharide biosynthesis
MGGLKLLDIRGEAAAELTLRDVLVPLFRHRRLMALSFFGIFLGGILAALLLANQYQAHFRVLVKRQRVDPVVSSEASSQTIQPGPPVTEEEINSEVELLQSDDLLHKVVLATGLQEKQRNSVLAFMQPKEDAETLVSKAVKGVAKQLHVEAVKKTDLIEVSYQTTDPQLTYRVLNTLANFYLVKHLAVHRPPGALDFFQQESEQYRSGLATAKVRLGQFIQENKVANAGGERDLMLQGLSRFDATWRDTETAIAETQRRIGDLEAQLKVTPARLSTAQKASDNAGVLQILEGTLATLELKHSDMTAHYDPDYRPLKDLENQVAQARAQVDAAKSTRLREDTTDTNPTYLWLTEELVKARADLATFQARAAASAHNVQLYRQMALDLGQKDLEQEDLIRNAKVEEDNLLLYLKKREEARISDALDSKRILNVAISEPPTVPALPAHSPWYFVLLGTLLAAVVSTAAAFVSDYIDPTLRTADEARRVLDIPVLASLPKVQRGFGADVPRILPYSR